MAAKSGTYTIDDPNAIVDGKAIAQWTQDWETWYIQSPAYQNAVDDKTGKYANVGNDQPGMFFIGGTAGSDATRTFTVPQGEALLVPMINNFDTLDPKGHEKQLVNNFLAGVTDLSAEIDGKPIANLGQYLETSDFFSMGTVKPNTVFTELFGNGYNGQELTPTLAAGYYLMIEGLSLGQHTLEFGGSSNGFSTHAHQSGLNARGPDIARQAHSPSATSWHFDVGAPQHELGPTFCGDYATAKVQADELVALANEKNAMQWKAFGMLDQGCVLTLAGKASASIQMITSGLTAFRSTGARFRSRATCRFWREPMWTSANSMTPRAALVRR